MMRPTQLTLQEQFGLRLSQERRLKAVRDQRDIDQKTVADAMDVAPATVSRWEAGMMPRDDVLVRLAEYFGVSVAWLRYGEGERAPATPAPDEKFRLSHETVQHEARRGRRMAEAEAERTQGKNHRKRR